MMSDSKWTVTAAAIPGARTDLAAGLLRRTLPWVLLCLSFDAAGAPVAAYQPLAFLAGHCWQGTFPDGKQVDRHCFSWIYGGKFLRDAHVVQAPGHADYQGETIYFWNSATRRIEYLYIENAGGFSLGSMSTDQNDLLFAPTDHVTDGATQAYRSRWRRNGDHAYEVITEFQSKDGWAPHFTVHMEAIAEQ
jgi:hypothetical protein